MHSATLRLSVMASNYTTNINVQDKGPFKAEVFAGSFMKMPLSVFKLRVVEFTFIEEFNELCVNVDL